MGEKRIIEEPHVNVMYNDDYAAKDSTTNGTTAMLWSDIKSWINSGMATESDLENAIANFASEYSTSTPYAVGDFCVFDGVLYECIGATTGDWDSTKWSAITVGDKLISLDADVATLLRDIISNGYAWSSTTHYAKNSIVIYNKAIYKCAVDNPTVGTFVDNEWFKTDAKSLIEDVEEMICSKYQPSSVGLMHKYYVGDLVWIYENYKKVIYIANTENQDSSWTASHWDKVTDISGLSKYLMDKIAEAGQIDDVQVKTTGDYESVVDENKVAKIDLSNMLIEKSVPNLPQSVATFNDGSDLPLKSLKVAIEPQQGGSGDPSPTNRREISGYTSVVLNNAPFITNVNSDRQVVWNWKNGNTDISAPMNICHYETVKDSNNNDIEVADLEWHYVLPFDCVYDEPEAIYEAPAGGLEAGTYYFTIKNDSWGGNNGKIVQFILAEALTEGQQIRKRSGAYNSAIENCTLGIFTSGADRTGTELAFTVVTENPTGTSLGETDGTGDLNYWPCVVLGYNRWKYSAVRQYLNSDKAAGSWWTQQHKWDVKPAYADTKDGFLKGYDSELLHYMQVTKVTTARNTVFNSGDTPLGGMDETYDRVFLISLEQSYINPQISGEGEYWEYYKRLLGRTTPASTGATYARLIKYDLAAQTTARYRWLRSAYRSTANSAWDIYSSGRVYNGSAHNGFRLAPCLRIKTSDLHTQTISFPNEVGTIYKGEYDITNGTLKSYTHYDSYNGENIDGEWISDRDKYAEGTTPTIGAEVQVMSGSNYTTYQVQPTAIKSLDGVNNVWASTGDVAQLEYIANATDVIANLEARVTALENQ